MATTETSLTLDTIDFTDPDKYAREGYPWEDFRVMRREAPRGFWYEKDYIDGFWAFGKQPEIHFISRHPKQFISSRRLVLAPRVERQETSSEEGPGSIITTDPPDHAMNRSILSRSFTPKALKAWEPRVRELTNQIIDEVIEKNVDPATGVGRCDFVLDISAKLPLYVICEMMGVPPEDSKKMFDWTNEALGAADPEYQRGRTIEQTREEARVQQQGYFYNMVQARKAEPKDDLTSILLAGKVRGEGLTDRHVLAELGLLMAGGIETTRNATTGGWLALINNPDQYDILKADHDLIPSAVEESLRWATPIIHFGRECTEDTQVGDVLVKKGQAVGMWYASANRDEDVFENSDVFDVRRYPNEHLAFGGFGEHFCLGANLARTELWEMFRGILNRFERFELDGEVSRLRSAFIGGIKHMPVKFTVKS